MKLIAFSLKRSKGICIQQFKYNYWDSWIKGIKKADDPHPSTTELETLSVLSAQVNKWSQGKSHIF